MMSEEQLKYLRILGEEGDKKYRLTGMFKNWFLEYSSYVILERAIPPHHRRAQTGTEKNLALHEEDGGRAL